MGRRLDLPFIHVPLQKTEVSSGLLGMREEGGRGDSPRESPDESEGLLLLSNLFFFY